jgi:F0F1-type ATP synthase membrane subunit c/vacuolar-type H+-ATPase subunit K
MISIAMLVVAPAAYLVVAFIIDPANLGDGGFNEFVLYILLIVAAAQPAVVLAVQKTIQGAPRSDVTENLSEVVGSYFTQSLLRLAIVEAVYIYGLVIFLISGQLGYMLYFYPIGVVWTLILWPRRSAFEKLIVENNAS